MIQSVGWQSLTRVAGFTGSGQVTVPERQDPDLTFLYLPPKLTAPYLLFHSKSPSGKHTWQGLSVKGHLATFSLCWIFCSAG